MFNYGIFEDIDSLKETTNKIQSEDLIPTVQEQDDEKHKNDTIIVPTILSDKFDPSQENNNLAATKIGASGNRPKEDTTKEPDPQMELGTTGLKMNLKKEFARTEAFDGTTDEEPMKDAKDKASENMVDRINNLFSDNFNPTQDAKDPRFNYDFSKSNVIMKDDLLKFKIKRGW